MKSVGAFAYFGCLTSHIVAVSLFLLVVILPVAISEKQDDMTLTGRLPTSSKALCLQLHACQQQDRMCVWFYLLKHQTVPFVVCK
jgi:hypothetical protein